MDATINGLKDGVSVLEANKNDQPSIASDMLYNNQEIDFDQFYNDGEYVYPNFDYQSMYMDCINLLSMPEETFDLNDRLELIYNDHLLKNEN